MRHPLFNGDSFSWIEAVDLLYYKPYSEFELT